MKKETRDHIFMAVALASVLAWFVAAAVMFAMAYQQDGPHQIDAGTP